MINEKVWGWEDVFFNGHYCVKKLFINPLYQTSIHYHKLKDEVFTVLWGKVQIECNGEPHYLSQGDQLRVRALEKHRIACVGGSQACILESSTHHEDSDSYRETKSGKIGTI